MKTIALVGPQNAGKTALLRVAQYALTEIPRTVPTIGIDLSIVRGHRVWDTSGNPRFEIVVRSILKGATTVIVVRARGQPYTLPDCAPKHIVLATRGEDDEWVEEFMKQHNPIRYRVDTLRHARHMFRQVLTAPEPSWCCWPFK